MRKSVGKSKPQPHSLPHAVARRIRERCAKEKAIVVTARHGVASRVFGLEEYLAKRETARAAKPWTHRRSKRVPDPLGAVEGKVKEPIRRESIYG